MSYKEFTLTVRLNEPQQESFAEAQKRLKGCHFANLRIRANGQDYNLEADYLRDAFIKAKPVESSST